MRYIVGFTKYIDLPEGTSEAFIQELDRLYGPGQGVNYILGHLRITEDKSIDYYASEPEEVKTDPPPDTK